MKFHKTQGIIINKLAVRDADRFLTIYTLDYGKISCYARGIRSIKSSRVTKIDLFSKIKFELIQKKDNFTLTHVELLNSYRNNKKELHNISRLFQIGEVIDALTPENDPSVTLYHLLLTALDNLDKFSTPEYLKRFKMRVLQELGYGQRDGSYQQIDQYIESIIERPLRANHIF